MTTGLTAEQQKALQEVIVLADQRKAALESKRIEQSGGMHITSLSREKHNNTFNFQDTRSRNKLFRRHLNLALHL